MRKTNSCTTIDVTKVPGFGVEASGRRYEQNHQPQAPPSYLAGVA
jgi:hypothetical protein